jgi:hypothetical protein
MERKNKPSAIPVSPSLPQPVIEISADSVLTATLPSHDSVKVHLYGATVTSWTTSDGEEQLFLSEKAVLDGSKAIRGGIPVVFPVFGPPPEDHATSALPQHGFARTSYWEYLGKSTSESSSSRADDSVKLDFGLSTAMLDEKARKAWPYEFGLVYSITLGKGTLETAMHVQNKGDKSFDFQCLFHTYLRIKVRRQTGSFSPWDCQTDVLVHIGHIEYLNSRPQILALCRQSPRCQAFHRGVLRPHPHIRNRPRLHPAHRRRRLCCLAYDNRGWQAQVQDYT